MIAVSNPIVMIVGKTLKIRRLRNRSKLATCYHEVVHILMARRNRLRVKAAKVYSDKQSPYYAAVVISMEDSDSATINKYVARRCLEVCIAGSSADSLVLPRINRKRYKSDLRLAVGYAAGMLAEMGIGNASLEQLRRVTQYSFEKVLRVPYRERHTLTKIAYLLHRGKRL